MGPEVIVLLDTLNDPVNMYLDLPKLSILQSVNDQEIESMAQLVGEVRARSSRVSGPVGYLE